MKLSTYLTLAAGTLVVAATPAIAVEKVDASTIELPAPPEGKGQIIFFRKGRFVGGGINCTVYEGGEKVSSLGGGRYFILVAEPGRHEFTVKSESKDLLALEVEPDESQFASCKIKTGIFVGRPDIRPATEAGFRKAKLGLVDADDMVSEGVLRPEQVAEALASGNAGIATVTEEGVATEPDAPVEEEPVEQGALPANEAETLTEAGDGQPDQLEEAEDEGVQE